MMLWELPQKPKLLIVDDDADVASMLCTYFARHAETQHVSRAEEAIHQCAQAEYDLVILDIGLPDMSGYDLFRALRLAGYTMPTIFLTQRDERHDKIAGLELGADDYITKPFDIDELWLRVRNALLRSQRHAFPPTQVALLRQTLIKRFDLEELRNLCFDLELNFDHLRGEGQEAKARELIAHLQRRERLGQLVTYIRQHRPDIKL